MGWKSVDDAARADGGLLEPEVLLFLLTELIVEQSLNFGQRLVGIAARGFQLDCHPNPAASIITPMMLWR